MIKKIIFTNSSRGFLNKNCNTSVYSKIDYYRIGEDINCSLSNMMMRFILVNYLKTFLKKLFY